MKAIAERKGYQPDSHPQELAWDEHLLEKAHGDGNEQAMDVAYDTVELQVVSLEQLGLAWELLCAVAAAACAGLYARTQSWQALTALGLGFAAAILCRTSRRWSRHRSVDAGASTLLVAGLVMPLLATLCIAGVTPLLSGLALVLPVGTVALVWPQRWLARGLYPGIVSALACGFVDRLVRWNRLNAAETSPSALVGAVLAAIGLGSLLWALANRLSPTAREPGSDRNTRLLVSFLLVLTPPAAAVVAIAMAWRWSLSTASEALGVPAASWPVGAGLCLGSIALSVALASRLAKDLDIALLSPLTGRASTPEAGNGMGMMRGQEGTVPVAEERLSQRAAELEQRCRHAETLVELSRVSLSLLHAQRLSRAVVDVVRNGLSLEYVALYRLDPEQAWLELRAENGTNRWGPPSRAERIPVGEGPVGRAVANAQLTAAVREETRRLGDDHDTVQAAPTQVALPLRARGRLLGVLVCQAALPQKEGRELVDVLRAMASHIALALDNARLLEEGQAAIDAARRASGALSLDAWRNVLDARTDLGFRSNEHGVERTGHVWLPRMARAGEQNTTILGRRDDADPVGCPQPHGQTLTVPIRIHGEVIGVLDTYKPDGEGAWTSEQVDLVEQITEELSQALENARLYEETQRRGIRERQLREIATRMGSSVDLDVIMRTAVEDVAKALGVPSGFVQLYERRPSTGNGPTG